MQGGYMPCPTCDRSQCITVLALASTACAIYQTLPPALLQTLHLPNPAPGPAPNPSPLVTDMATAGDATSSRAIKRPTSEVSSYKGVGRVRATLHHITLQLQGSRSGQGYILIRIMSGLRPCLGVKASVTDPSWESACMNPTAHMPAVPMQS